MDDSVILFSILKIRIIKMIALETNVGPCWLRMLLSNVATEVCFYLLLIIHANASASEVKVTCITDILSLLF